MEQNIRIKEEKCAMKVSGFVVLYDYISKSKKKQYPIWLLEIERNTKNFDFRTKKTVLWEDILFARSFQGSQ